MPRIPAPPSLDHFTGTERELVDLIGPYCLGGQPDRFDLVYEWPVTVRAPKQPTGLRISCMLKPAGDPQTSRATRAALFAAADSALNAIEDAGWTWARTPQIDIRGDRYQNPDHTWHDCWRGTLELTLNWKASR